MDRAAAIEFVEVTLGTFAEGVSAATWDMLLARSVMPDTTGRWPGSTGYTDTYDPNWAAAELVALKAEQAMTSGQLVEWASEGSRFRSTPADLVSLESKLRSRSYIACSAGDPTLERLTVSSGRASYDTRSQGWPAAGNRYVVTNAD